MPFLFSSILLLVLLTSAASETVNNETAFKPIKALSVEINAKVLELGLQDHKMSINEGLELVPEMLKNCQVIGSISNINLKGNKDLQFYFTYHLQPQNSVLQINIFARQKNNQKISQDLRIILDFFIAIFPQDYKIFTYNITSYQEHIPIVTNRKYELIFFLNGFNNFSLSGNITHSYQDGDHVYTVHYMSCVGEDMQMGWRQDKDYLLFTLMIVPVTNLVQKFKLTRNSFSLDHPKGFKYFYGLKGSTDEEFVGSFKERLGGVIFKAQNLDQYSTYGLVFLPYPSNALISDERSHNSLSVFSIIGITIASLIVLLIICYALSKRCYLIGRLLNSGKEDYNFEISESTKNDLKQTDISRHKYEINTVEEVDEKYESSLKNSYQPRADQEPSLVLKE